jgi:hypothetical protein
LKRRRPEEVVEERKRGRKEGGVAQIPEKNFETKEVERIQQRAGGAFRESTCTFP